MDAGLISSKACLFIISLFLISYLLIIPAGNLQAQHVKGYLQVTSQPSQSMVYIDSEFTNSRTPTQKLIERVPGDYRLGVVKNGYKLYEDKVTIRAGEVLEARIILSKADSEEPSRLGSEQYVEAYLSVRSTPSGAEVYLDNESIGTTPVKDYKILPGESRNRNLKITAPGYRPFEDVIEWDTIKDGIKIYISPKLEPEMIEPEARAEPESKPKTSPLSKGRKRFTINTQVITFAVLLIVLIGVLVVRIVLRIRQGSDEE